jgi:hypothetical protein
VGEAAGNSTVAFIGRAAQPVKTKMLSTVVRSVFLMTFLLHVLLIPGGICFG